MAITATQRARAFRMFESNRDSNYVAEKIGLEPRSVAALKANWTRNLSPAPVSRSTRSRSSNTNSSAVRVNVRLSARAVQALANGESVEFIISSS